MDAGECGFLDIIKKIEEEGLSQQVQLFLSVLLPKTLVTRSIKLLYHDATIKCFIAKNSRRCYWTMLSNHNDYIIFSDVNSTFCSCLSYVNYVIKKGQYPFCKHVLTVLICEALRKKKDTSQFAIEELDDEVFSSNIASAAFSTSFKPKQK